MASKKQISWVKKLLERNGAKVDDYKFSELIPHSVISPFIGSLSEGTVMSAKEWNAKIAQFTQESSDNLDWEMDQIKSIFIRNSVKAMMKKAPEYFWSVPASSTGKYHPQYALGKGGLVRHTKAAVKIALGLFENALLHSFNQDDQDIILGALILHDSCKHGIIKQEYTINTHPLLPEKLWEESMAEGASTEQMELMRTMFDAIRSHMGPWNTDRYGNEILPIPKGRLQRFVHMCDYLASRKFLEVVFNQ